MARPVTISPVNFPLIRHHMKERKYTLKRMAGKLGCQISHLSEMLSGLRPLNDERLIIISDELKVPHNYFRTSIGRMLIQKTDADLILWSLDPERGDVKELQDYLDVGERMGYIDFSLELPDEDGVLSYDFWKKAVQAEVGIFITIEPISQRMRQIQADEGTFEHNGKTYNRLQFWQIDDAYFENPDVVNQILHLPWRIESRNKSERPVEDRQGRFL